MVDHGKGHEYDLLSEVGAKELDRIQGLVDEAKTKAQGYYREMGSPPQAAQDAWHLVWVQIWWSAAM